MRVSCNCGNGNVRYTGQVNVPGLRGWGKWQCDYCGDTYLVNTVECCHCHCYLCDETLNYYDISRMFNEYCKDVIDPDSGCTAQKLHGAQIVVDHHIPNPIMAYLLRLLSPFGNLFEARILVH